MIGGNTTAILQRNDSSATNAIGEKVQAWVDVVTLMGWLDLQNGDSKYTYNAKLQDSTHIFLCDYVAIDRKPNGKRLKVGDTVYDVLLIDDPMELHQHLEFILKVVG